MSQACPQCGGDLPANGFEGLCPRCVAMCLQEFENQEIQSHPVDAFSMGNESQMATAPAPLAAIDATSPEAARSKRAFDYELLEEIGRGGMGVVYRARQLSLNRIVAVKTILSGPVASVAAVKRFRAEAEALARLKHPNIVSIYDIFQHDGHHFFSMEYVAGKSLAELASEHPLPPVLAARYTQKIAEAVQFAHHEGLLHRDLKPSNILIDDFGEPRVTDFGLAKRLNAEADLSYTGQLVGSPQYFAPEQLSSKKGAVGPYTDVYSIGAVLYHLITGRPPFNAASLEEVLLKVIDTEPAPPHSLVEGVPRDLETICLKCLQKEPAQRYASARDLANDLGRFLAFEPIEARPVSARERAWRWFGRRKALTGAWAAVLLLMMALVLVLSRKNGALRGLGAPPLAPVLAYAFTDHLFYDTNWTLAVNPLAGSSELQARQIPGYTNAPFPIWTNPVRETTYQLGPNLTILAFHLCTNATFDPSLSGEITELGMSVSAHQIDGAGNARVAPCLEQDGRLYTYTRPQAASPSDMSEIIYRGMKAADFSVPKGVGYDGDFHPDFSCRGGPIQFGFVVRDTDPKRGHFGWVAVGAFNLTAFGPIPTSFPFADASLDKRNWTVHPIANGSPVVWEEAEEPVGGNPGQYLRVSLKLGDRTSVDLIHVCQGALYCPASQGALESIDVSVDTRMAADSSGRSANVNICPIIVQNRTIYAARWRMATYSEQNRGWVPLDFMGLDPRHLGPYTGLSHPIGLALAPDFSTNGAAMRFGFATRNVTFHNNPQGHAFSTAIDFDNFVVKVRSAQPPR